MNPAVRAEGITETLGDILLTCSGGAPGSVITLNLSIFLNVSITNRISATNATDVSLTVDSGAGPVPASVPGLLQSSNAVSFNGVTFTVPAGGGKSSCQQSTRERNPGQCGIPAANSGRYLHQRGSGGADQQRQSTQRRNSRARTAIQFGHHRYTLCRLRPSL